MRKFLATASLFIFVLNFAAADILQKCSEEISAGQAAFSRSELPEGDNTGNTLHMGDAGEEESRCRVRSRILSQTAVPLADRPLAALIKSRFFQSSGTLSTFQVCTELLKQRAPPVIINL